MHTPPYDLSQSQGGLLNRSTNGVVAITDDRQAEVVRPQCDPARESHIAAKCGRPDAYYDAADMAALALKHPVDDAFDLPSHAGTNVNAFSLNGYPHSYLAGG